MPSLPRRVYTCRQVLAAQATGGCKRGGQVVLPSQIKHKTLRSHLSGILEEAPEIVRSVLVSFPDVCHEKLRNGILQPAPHEASVLTPHVGLLWVRFSRLLTEVGGELSLGFRPDEGQELPTGRKPCFCSGALQPAALLKSIQKQRI